MQPGLTTNHQHHNPPRPPPLCVSLTQTRPESPIPADKFYSPLTSPLPLPISLPHQIIQFNRRDDATPANSAVVHGGGEGKARRSLGVRFGAVEELGTKAGREDVVAKVGVGVRIAEIVLCLISFSVMAADKSQGWSGDSFDRYKEYRFCLTVAVFGFVYSAFQAYDLGSHLATGKHVITHHLRYQFDFIMDQILAYLLISASSAAASRVDNWQSNWGKDEFTEKASASISMAFLAFLCFAMSSLISGYNLCSRDLY